MSWNPFRTAHDKVDSFVKYRGRQSNAALIRDCGMEGDQRGARMAIGVRRAIAGVGLVDPMFIRASDRYPDDLEKLPLWDSMDFVALLIQIEKKLGVEISVRRVGLGPPIREILCHHGGPGPTLRTHESHYFDNQTEQKPREN